MLIRRKVAENVDADPSPPHFIINLSHQNWTCFLKVKIISKNVLHA
jgi:hypothetical protein